MATKTKKATAKKAVKKPAAKKAVKKTAAKKAAPKKVVKKTTAKKAAPKKVVKKTTAKKAAPKKAAVKKVAAKKAAPKAIKSAKAVMTKSQVVTTISEHVDLPKKQVTAVLDVLDDIIAAHVKKGSVGQFKLNSLLNIKAVKKPARKARKGVNPFTGEEIMIKAKPAYRSVRVTALKRLKEMADK